MDWSYAGENGPDRWSDINSDYRACNLGAFQSPVDISNSIGSPELRPLIFHYHPIGLDLEFDGRVINGFPHNPLKVEFEDKTFQLYKITIHTPSEHKINSDRFDAEIQLFHRSEKHLLNIAVPIVDGAKNRQLADLVDKIPKQPHQQKVISDIYFRKIIPKKSRYYRYSGSFTKPPCKEGVVWVVYDTPLQMSGFQLDQWQLVQGKNNRPTQDLGQRIPLESR